ELSADKSPDIASVAKKAMRAVQKRALNTTKRLAMKGGGLASRGAKSALSKGKKVDDKNDTASSGGSSKDGIDGGSGGAGI
ncbi:MAG: hypothetical protein ACKO6C_02770, partial [Alphaproteobacteria bacterium]